MDRRTLLALMGAAALAGCGQRKESSNNLRIVVVGAGIIGASIAYHLARSGASVTVIDKSGPATHASRGTFAWINATWAKQPKHYHSLNQDGLASWKELQKTLNLPVRWGGSLEWFDSQERQEKLALQISEQNEWNEPARMVKAPEFSLLEPGVDFPLGSQAAYSPNDGAVDPVVATNILLNAAEQFGARVHYPAELQDVSISNGRLKKVFTSNGTIEADRLVLATGAEPDIAKKITGIEIPQRSTPGVIAITKPIPRLINRIIAAPGAHLHQRDDGRVVIGEQGGPPKNEAHVIRLKERPNGFPVRAIAEQHYKRMLSAAKKFVPGIVEAELAEAYIGWRPLPIDGHPVLGSSSARPDVYFAIMHSGVSLAPIVGQLATYELLENVAVDKLAPYRPDREFKRVRRY